MVLPCLSGLCVYPLSPSYSCLCMLSVHPPEPSLSPRALVTVPWSPCPGHAFLSSSHCRLEPPTASHPHSRIPMRIPCLYLFKFTRCPPARLSSARAVGS